MEFLIGIWIGILGLLGMTPEPESIAGSAMVDQEVAIKEQITADLRSSEASDDTTEVIEQTAEVEMSSGALASVEQITSVAKPDSPQFVESGTQTMIVAGGCFWCVEADLEKTPGVLSVVSGYAGGSTDNPTYSNYGSGGHREVVEVTYDANKISFEDILIVTLKTTDPTDDDGTFADRGDKYSSAFYYENTAQKTVIDALIAEVDEKGPYDAPLAIDVEPTPTFWKAEDNHQDYYKGTLTQVKYKYYRNASGRTDFIKKYWGDDTSPNLPWRTSNQTTMTNQNRTHAWSGYTKPDDATLKASLDSQAYKVTQHDGTERAGTSPLDKNWERGIYVDILSGEPLYSSRDKFDSGTGWPSFTKPITADAVVERVDRKLFVKRVEIRSAIADNHLGHVFSDGPKDSTGLRYCMNGVALTFVPEAEMDERGYGDYLSALQ